MDPKLYFAAGLFNAPQTMFNQYLARLLQACGYYVILPQRDGFEFGRLAKALSPALASAVIPDALQIMIYLLDLWFVSQSQIVLACLDEPVDEGVVVEMTYGRLLGKAVISFRTDVRSPYGNPMGRFGGGHFFPAMQARVHINCSLPARNADEAEHGIQALANTINTAVGLVCNDPEYQAQAGGVWPKLTQNIIDRAEYLFGHIADLHSDTGVAKIAKRYTSRQAWLGEIFPSSLRF